MADPLTVFGAAASFMGIIDVLSKSILIAHNLRSQWKDADLIFLNLATQLVALKAALTKIKECTEKGLVEPHHQLIMDLDSSWTCCNIIVGKIDNFLSELQQKSNSILDVSTKARLLLGIRSMDDLQRMLERQLNALNLLLNACSFDMALEQKIFLEKSSTRKMLKKVSNDSASLVVHRDKDSLFSRCTDSWSKLSMKFTFDSELFGSKVYEQFLRGSLKTALRDQQSDNESVGRQSALRENGAIEKQIALDKKKQRDVSIHIFSLHESDISVFIRNLQLLKGGISSSERRHYRYVIFVNLLKAFKAALDLMMEKEMEFENELNPVYADYIARNFDIQSANPLPEGSCQMFESLWADKWFRCAIFDWQEYALRDCLIHCFTNVDRFLAPDYLPTDEDILRTSSLPTGVTDTVVEMKNQSFHFINARGQHSERKKWIHVLGNTQFTLFLVALSSFDEPHLKDSGKSRLNEGLVLFESIVKSTYFARSVPIILFTGVDEFREKILSGKSPINKYFPDYTASSNDIDAGKYFFARKFQSVLREYSDLYVLYGNVTDMGVFNEIQASVAQSFLQQSMRDCGIV